MKGRIILLVFFLFRSCHCANELAHFHGSQVTNIDISAAVVEITKYTKIHHKKQTVNVITVKQGGFAIEDYTTDILMGLKESNMLYRLEHYDKFQDIKQRRRVFNIVLVQTYDMFERLASKLFVGDFVFEGFYVYVLHHGTMLDVMKMMDILWRHFFYNVIIIHEVDNVVNVVAFEPFSSTRCGVAHPVILNYYSNKTFLYNNVAYFPEKFNNLFNCPIRVGGTKTRPSLLKTQLANGSYILTGIDAELMNHLGAMLNFKLKISYETEDVGEIYENGTSKGTMKKIMKGEYEMLFGNLFLTPIRLKYLSTSNPYFAMPFVLIVPSGVPFTAFEKLFKPFHTTVWLYLTGIFLCGTIIIFLIKLQMKSVQDFAFGERITNQYTNLLLIFVGGSQHVLPRHNFARYLLMIFILFCLIQRTLYQGSLYKFLQSDNRASEVKTIDEMIDRQFHFYMYPSFRLFTKYSRIYNRSRLYTPEQGTAYYEMRLKDPHFLGAITTTSMHVAYMNQLNYKNSTFNLCKENILSIPIVICFQKNHYLVKAVNEKIEMLNSAGFISNWLNKHMEVKSLQLKGKSNNNKPKQLNLQQLLGSIQVFVFGCLLSILTFFGEKFWKFYF